jgi:hypothetical protein
MIPLKANRIRAKLEKHDKMVLRNDTFMSIERMAFERNFDQ